MPAADRVIIDTSAFYALVSSNDYFHVKASVVYEHLLEREWDLWTTSYVMVETAALVHHRLGFEPLSILMETILSDPLRVLWVEHSIHREAWRRMAAGQGKGLSLVDWTTAVAAERLSASVFTFDGGFRQQGISIFPR